MLGTAEFKEKLLLCWQLIAPRTSSSFHCWSNSTHSTCRPSPRQPVRPWEPCVALRKGKQAQALHPGIAQGCSQQQSVPKEPQEIPNFLPLLPASFSPRLPLRSEPRRNPQESTALAREQASCSRMAQPTRKGLNLSSCHSPNYSLCLESNNNRASFMSSSHQEPWNLMHAAKHWEVLKGQGVAKPAVPGLWGRIPVVL